MTLRLNTGGFTLPKTIAEKKELLLNNKIALWDVVKSCKISGSSDSSIEDVIANDIQGLILKTNIKKLYANGSMAYSLYNKYCFKETNLNIKKLPSTSPANARYSLKKLIFLWGSSILGANK